MKIRHAMKRINEVKTITVGPNEYIAVKINRRVSAHDMERLKDVLKRFFEGRQVLVLDQGAELIKVKHDAA